MRALHPASLGVTTANLLIGRIGKAMPLMLDPADHAGWLDGSIGVASLRAEP